LGRLALLPLKVESECRHLPDGLSPYITRHILRFGDYVLDRFDISLLHPG